jgi:hypothetical protein
MLQEGIKGEWIFSRHTLPRNDGSASFPGTRLTAMIQRANHWLWYGSAAVAVTAIGIALWHFTIDKPHSATYDPPALFFDGTSDRLKQTVIVPTLDSPIPEGKSAIWCVSFQLAWNHLKDDVAREPLKLTKAQPIADRLNRADHSEADVGADAVYAAAGLAKNGIVEHIRAQMASQFPNVPKPELDLPADGAVAYAYLAASAKYDNKFVRRRAADSARAARRWKRKRTDTRWEQPCSPHSFLGPLR